MVRKLGKSFHFAFRGIHHAVNTQRNFKIHLTAAVLVVIFAAVLKISVEEWVSLTLVVGMVLVSETLNTAIEEAVNLSSPSMHVIAEKAKDTAAAAVLISSICAIITGVLILGPRLIKVIF